MHDGIQPARRCRWAHLPAVALALSVVLLAGCTGSPGSLATTPPARPALTGAVSGCLRYPGSCYAPRLFRVAYGIQPLLDAGIDGRGETVTVLGVPVPAAAGSPQPVAATAIRQDLAAFDRVFRLPAARLQVVAPAGSASPGPAGGAEVGDLEEVHAVAPAAALRVVLMPANAAADATADLLAGLRLAVSRTGVAVVGWTLGEHFFTRSQVARMHAILRRAAAHHVTVVAGSGDYGAFSNPFEAKPVKEASLPAADPLVLAAGGTTLTANPLTGAYQGETGWNGTAGFSEYLAASGGGFSHRYARPAYQDGVAGIATARGVPDVAGDADQNGGTTIVLATGSRTSISPASGTSAAAALWGGLMALADQEARHGLGFVNPALYRIARGPGYHRAFHDITTGNNTLTMPYTGRTAGYHTAPGWDAVTGWGTPNAQALIPLLARSRA